MADPLVPPRVSPPSTDDLGDQIAELSAQIQAATFRLLVLIREFDRRGGFGDGFRSTAHWLNWRTGLDLGAAREKVRVARALAQLPRISEAMRTGELSYSKVRALTRIATPECEEELLGFARCGTAAHVEKLVRAWRRMDRVAESERDLRRRESRYLSLHTDETGMVVVRARLEPEAGAVLANALEAAGERLYEAERERRQKGDEPVQADQRRADAIALVAESALAAGLDPGSRGDRYQVVVHVDAEVLEGESDGGRSALERGADVSAETSRRLACDAARVEMTHDAEGQTLDVGRKTRTIPPALRRALRHRDAGCRFPGCGVTICDGHHVEHWADGGETRLDNLIELCRFHHRAVHEEGFRVELRPDGAARFFRRDGREVVRVPKMPEVGADPVAALRRRLACDGVEPDATTGFPTWEGETVDYGWAIEALWRPHEAPPGLRARRRRPALRQRAAAHDPPRSARRAPA